MGVLLELDSIHQFSPYLPVISSMLVPNAMKIRDTYMFQSEHRDLLGTFCSSGAASLWFLQKL